MLLSQVLHVQHTLADPQLVLTCLDYLGLPQVGLHGTAWEAAFGCVGGGMWSLSLSGLSPLLWFFDVRQLRH